MALSIYASPQRVVTFASGRPGGVISMASLRISGVDLDPALVTEALGVEPETAARRGGVLRRLRDGRTVIAPTGTWFATSEGRVSGGPVEHFRWALDLVRRGAGRSFGADTEIDLSLLMGGPEAEVIEAFRSERSRLLPLLQSGSEIGRVSVDLPTVGEEFCFAKGDRVMLPAL